MTLVRLYPIRRAALFAASLASWLSPARAAYDNYPVKSINIASAPDVEYYNTFGLEGLFGYFADPHAVHGSQTSDGGHVVCGKATEGGGNADGTANAFVVKVGNNGAYEWGWQSGLGGKLDACNAVVELPNGDVLAVGFRQDDSGNAQRSLTLLDSSSGALLQNVLFGSSDASKPHGAWEMAEVTDDGYLLLAGLTNSNDMSEFWFKSYGNVIDGQAIVQKYDLADVGVDMSEDVALFTYVDADYITCKSAKTTPDGRTVALLYSEEHNAALLLLEADGTVVWGPKAYGSVEGTDVAVSTDGSQFALTGHGQGDPSGIAGKLLLVNPSDGNLSHTKLFYSVPPEAGDNYQYVYNECWGIQPLSDGGYALACGTGIEECSILPTRALRRNCQRGNALLLDDRAGAIPRPVEKWQAMAIRVGPLGDAVWQRVDQWSLTGNTLGEYHSSAAEWAIVDTDGSIVTVNDEESGIGLFKLAAPVATTTTSTSTSTTTTPPETTTASTSTATSTTTLTSFSNHSRSSTHNDNINDESSTTHNDDDVSNHSDFDNRGDFDNRYY